MSLSGRVFSLARTVTSWFDPDDGLEVTLRFLLCLPFGFLITPPLFASQLPSGFLLFSLVGWIGLPTLTWWTAQAAHHRSGRHNRQAFGSLLLWLGIGYSWTPVFLLVSYQFWLQNDPAWAAGLVAISLFMIWQCYQRWTSYQLAADQVG